MSAFDLFQARRTLRRFSSYRSDQHDGYACCDVAPPNPHAQRRGFIVILIVAGVVAVVGMTFGLLQGLLDMLGAFPTGAAIFELSAWDKFFTGVGRLTILVLLCTAVVLVVRWRHRRAKRSKAQTPGRA